MKKFGTLFLALALVVGLTVQMSIPAVASNGSHTLYGIIGDYLVTIDATTGDGDEVAMLGGDTTGLMQDIAFNWQEGILYGLARTSATDRAPLLTTINVCTGEVTIIDAITLSGETVYMAEGLAIHPQSGAMYVSMSIDGDPSSTPADYYSETLVTVDPDTAVATYVATIDNTVQDEADALEFVGGTLYVADDPGSGPTSIYTIDIGSGVATLKGTLSSPRFNNVGDMAYNPDSGDLLYAYDPGAYTSGHPRHLCEISTTGTATATDIGEIHAASEFGGYIQGISWASVTCCIEVTVDIKPMSWPNPLNVNNKGVLPVAILGTEDFDVSQIDPASILLEGVSPLRWALEDVGTVGDPLAGPDGITDLSLKFAAQEIVAALGDVTDGEVVTLHLTGNLKEEFGGTPIEGEDVVRIIKKK